jgi:hypothetical protein
VGPLWPLTPKTEKSTFKINNFHGKCSKLKLKEKQCNALNIEEKKILSDTTPNHLNCCQKTNPKK